LTGLTNRREALVRLHDLWTIATRYRHPLSCALIDIDGFKAVNDGGGHLCGDAVLREAAGVLTKFVRECDILCRFGGDEFLVILPQTPADRAAEAIERCRTAVARHAFRSNGHTASLTISAGVYQAWAQMASVDELIHQADLALYAAKRVGKNYVAQSA